MITPRLGAALPALVLALLSACASAPPPSAATTASTASADPLSAYPPLPAAPAPGASPAARAYAASLKRGVNFGNMLEAPVEGQWGVTVDNRFIALVGREGGLGIESVRLPVRWSSHASLDAEARIDPAFMAHVEDIVRRLLARGVPVVLNMHHYRQLEGEAPDVGESRVADDVVDRRFFSMWRQVAERFKDYPPTLALEIYNEPHAALAPRWNDIMSRAVRLVRQSNPHRVLVVGPVEWNSARGLDRFVMPPDADLVLTVHHYDPFTFTHQGAEWVKPVMPTGVECCSAQQLADIRGPLDVAQRWGAEHGYPVWVGEFGSFDKAPAESRLRYTRTMRDEIERRGMSWAYWELASSFGFIDPKTAQVRPGGLHEALFGR